MDSSRPEGRRHVPWVYRQDAPAPRSEGKAAAEKARPKARLSPAPGVQQPLPVAQKAAAKPPAVHSRPLPPRTPVQSLPAHLAYGPLPGLGGYGQHFKPTPWHRDHGAEAFRPAPPPQPQQSHQPAVSHQSPASHPAPAKSWPPISRSSSSSRHQGPRQPQHTRAQAEPNAASASASSSQPQGSFSSWQRQRNDFAAHSGKSVFRAQELLARTGAVFPAPSPAVSFPSPPVLMHPQAQGATPGQGSTAAILRPAPPPGTWEGMKPRSFHRPPPFLSMVPPGEWGRAAGPMPIGTPKEGQPEAHRPRLRADLDPTPAPQQPDPPVDTTGSSSQDCVVLSPHSSLDGEDAPQPKQSHREFSRRRAAISFLRRSKATTSGGNLYFQPSIYHRAAAAAVLGRSFQLNKPRPNRFKIDRVAPSSDHPPESPRERLRRTTALAAARNRKRKRRSGGPAVASLSSTEPAHPKHPKYKMRRPAH